MEIAGQSPISPRRASPVTFLAAPAPHHVHVQMRPSPGEFGQAAGFWNFPESPVCRGERVSCSGLCPCQPGSEGRPCLGRLSSGYESSPSGLRECLRPAVGLLSASSLEVDGWL